MKPLGHLLMAAVLAGAALPLSPGSASAMSSPPQSAPADADQLAPLTLIDQRKAEVALPDGRVWLVTFFYGHCPDVCPLLLYNMQDAMNALPEKTRAKMGFAAVTFDPARDDVAFNADHAEAYNFTASNNYVFTGEPATLARMFKTFRFDYKPDRDGGFQHVNMLAVLDGQGRVVRHYYGLQPNIPLIVEQVKELVGE